MVTNRETLKKTHEYFDDNIQSWQLYIAAYEGLRQLVKLGAFPQHPRELKEEYEARLQALYGFNYSKAVVDVLNHHLTKKEPENDLGALANDDLWASFSHDCDLAGNDFQSFMVEQQRYASIYGHVGILVDKPRVETQTRQEEKEQGIHPYLAAYHPQNVLDWTFGRNASGRPFLSYLKLKDEDGQYRIWTPEKWETWQETEDEKGRKGEPTMVASGDNKLGAIPFVWLFNIKSRFRGIGVSDITEIANIDVSIINNLSQGEQIINYAAFPMMLYPEGKIGDGDGEIEVGPQRVIPFDPNYPDAKPGWLDAPSLSPVQAILEWIDRKIQEVYRTANIGGLNALESSTQAKSGVALRQEFQMLNAHLVRKAKNLEEAERSIIYYWLIWQNQGGLYKDVTVKRPKNFDIEDLVADLQNAMTAKALISSRTFSTEIQKSLARQMLPTISGDTQARIDKELEAQGTGSEVARLDQGLAELES